MTIKDTFKLSLVAATMMVAANAQSAIDGDDLPPAKPGQCFTKAFFLMVSAALRHDSIR